MSTPELEQAIAASRWHGAEANFTEAISKMLDVPPAVVARVVFAWETMKKQPLTRPIVGQMDILRDKLQDGAGLPPETHQAIEHAAVYAFRRMAIRWRMERGFFLEVPFKALVPANKPDRVCDGCPLLFECVRDALSTPEKCLTGETVYAKDQPDPKRTRFFAHQNASVKPVRLVGNVVTVTADHPLGVHTVNVMDVLV